MASTVYLDNAATTPMAPEVIAVMQAAMQSNFGNPSSTHQIGRRAKTAVETARKEIAAHFNVTAQELVFTSSGTEADNLILQNAVLNLGVTRLITTKIEHHAVLHMCEHLHANNGVVLDFVDVLPTGAVDLQHLETLLKDNSHKTLVSLMFINNEIGTLLPIEEVGNLCKTYNALFHSDTVQAIGHYHLDLQNIPVDFLVASAHKFHGPKGVGFAFFRKGFGILPMLHGGNQERGARSGTENVHAILGMAKALSTAIAGLEKDAKHIKDLKTYFCNGLVSLNSKIVFNGNSNSTASAYTILNVRLPVDNPMLLFSLDMAGIAVSGGSACQSGSQKGSHVLEAILKPDAQKHTAIRFSFSKYTTKADIDFTLSTLASLL